MIAKNLPGLQNREDLQRTIQSLADAVYFERRLGRNKQADLFEETIKALSEIRFEETSA